LYGTRPDGQFGGADLYFVTRPNKDAPWHRQRLTNLGGNVNSPDWDRLPDISADGRELYFNRSPALKSGHYDLYVATRNDVTDLLGFAPAQDLGPVVNDPLAADFSPNISSNGLWLFFSSNRGSGFGDFDLWVSMRPSLDAPWEEPVNLGDVINTNDYEGDPSVSADNTTLYFSRGPNAFNPEDIWQVPILRRPIGATGLQAGDADQDLDFDQLDLVKAQIAAKFLSGQPATWGEGDWDGAPGGAQGNPPVGNGRFDQLDIIAALAPGHYLSGPYAAIRKGGHRGDAQASILYDAATGEVGVDAPAGLQLTSINIDSAAGIFTGNPAQNLGGSFDNDSDNNIFKATFGSSFGSLTFGNVARSGLAKEFVLNDLTVVGSLAGGGALGDVDLIYIPEPTGAVLASVALVIFTLHLFGTARWM
jgi:hypothetical protein